MCDFFSVRARMLHSFGVINPGVFAIGDTLSVKGGFTYKPLPTFQPEIFAKVAPKDIGKRKAISLPVDLAVLFRKYPGAIEVARKTLRKHYSI
jgi:peptide chain release factor 3